MGLMDRDYMADRAAQRPFSPPPERSAASYLTILCVVLAGMFGLYKGADWLLRQRAAELVVKQQQPKPPAAAVTPNRPTAQPFPEQPTYQSPSQNAPATHTITKCVVNGKTSYGDGACGQGAVATQVVTRSNHNLMDAVAFPVVMAQPEPAQAMVVQSNGAGLSLSSKKAACQALDAEIVRLNALARQPQSAQSQDRITAERKQVRDEQYRMPCQ